MIGHGDGLITEWALLEALGYQMLYLILTTEGERIVHVYEVTSPFCSNHGRLSLCVATSSPMAVIMGFASRCVEVQVPYGEILPHRCLGKAVLHIMPLDILEDRASFDINTLYAK